MTYTVLPLARPARKKGWIVGLIAGLVLGCLALLVVLAWWSFIGREDIASVRYAHQVDKVHLPAGYEQVTKEHGGTYFAAGNGPSAAVGYRTSASVETAVADARAALEEAGYSVEPAPSWDSYGPPVTRLEGTAPGRDIEVLIGTGSVSLSPFGEVAAVPGLTGVLLVVEDHGRSR